MLKIDALRGVLGATAVAAICTALPAQAQTCGAARPASPQATQPATPAATPAGTSTAPRTGQNAAPLSAADQKMLKNMALTNLAEIEAARMAQGKSQSEEVKSFAQKMIDDHTKALEEVRQLAQARGVALPTEIDNVNKRKAERMAAMSGDAFDRAYMSQAGVADHKKAHAMLRQAQARAKDPELKALAARVLPVVGEHLNSAQQLQKNTARGSSRTQGDTGSSPDKRE